MATESVKILIEAEDQASAKIANASRAIEANVKNIKDVGGKAKASTEFIGQLANQLGGTQFASFAGQFAGLTEKVGQFAEVSKLGGAGAFAFKTGLVGLVGVLSFNLGKTIGDWWFETDRWNKELEEAIANSEKLTQKAIDLRNVNLQDSLTRVGFLDDPRAQVQAVQELIDIETKRAKEKQDALAREEASLKKLGAFFNATNALRDVGVNIGDTSEEKAIKANIENYRKEADAINETIKALQRRIGEEEKLRQEAEQAAQKRSSKAFIESLERENMLLAAQGDEVFELKAKYAGLTDDMAKQAIFLMKMADAERQRQELAKKTEEERKRALEQEQSERKKIIELIANENLKHQERFVAITKGKEAATALKFEQQGIAKAEAERLAAREAELDKLERAKQVEQDVKKQMLQPQEAFQSRFLSRGPLANPNQKLEEEAAKQTKLAEDQKKELERLVKATESRVKVRDVRLEVVE